MRPSEKQLELIQKISSEISGWENIKFYTYGHSLAINRFCESLYLTPRQKLKLTEALEDIIALSEEQTSLISKISSEISGWASTNDIKSSSHWSLIREFCESLELPAKQELKLNEALDEVMAIIKQQ